MNVPVVAFKLLMTPCCAAVTTAKVIGLPSGSVACNVTGSVSSSGTVAVEFAKTGGRSEERSMVKVLT